MAASGKKNDELFKQIMDTMDGDMKELDFLDQAIDYVRRTSTFLVVPTAGTKVKKLVNKHVATAKEDFDVKRKEEGKKAAERGEIPDVEEINMEDLNPVPVADLKKQKEEKKKKEKKVVPKKKAKKDPAKESEEDVEEEEEDDSPAPIGNGGEGPGYVWTQTLEEVEIRCEVPSTIRGKHLEINLGTNKMKCGIKRGGDTLMEGEWHAEIQDSLWTLETEKDKKFLVISIEKYKGMCWWPTVIKGHPEINTKKIQPENSKLESLDGETRQTVEKMMFDQRQKAMGKPTSKERSQQDKLKKFMDMHPEMDFSQAKFGGGMDGGNGGMAGMANMFGGQN